MLSPTSSTPAEPGEELSFVSFEQLGVDEILRSACSALVTRQRSPADQSRFGSSPSR